MVVWRTATRALLCIMRDRRSCWNSLNSSSGSPTSNRRSNVSGARPKPACRRSSSGSRRWPIGTAEYLKRWAATVERHTTAVSQLETYASEWKDSSPRVRQETADRLQELESTIEREWDTLKKMQEEPIRELREQAESLSQVSLAMANASQEGVERAEARFAAFETEVHSASPS